MNVLPYRVFRDGCKYFAIEAHPECFTPNRIFRSKYRGIISCNVCARNAEEAIQEAEKMILAAKFHDPERAEYIYQARKYGKRTFADIGRELGISTVRIRQVYRKIDWMKNQYETDHHKKGEENGQTEEKIAVVPDPTRNSKGNDD